MWDANGHEQEVSHGKFTSPFSGIAPPHKLSKRELTRGSRLAPSAEGEAIHLYEAPSDATEDELAKAVLQDVPDEEKVHAESSDGFCPSCWMMRRTGRGRVQRRLMRSSRD